jgi:hypothetical protein
VRGTEDVILRAAVAVHWNSGHTKVAYPDFVIADREDPSVDALSLAFLVRAVLDLAGVMFDSEGRLPGYPG